MNSLLGSPTEISAINYDVVFYQPAMKEFALSHVRRLSLDERKERWGGTYPIGLRIQQGIPLPCDDGPCPPCNCVWTADYGTSAFDPQEELTGVLEILSTTDGFIGANFTTAFKSSPAYIRAAENEKSGETNAQKGKTAFLDEARAKASAQFLVDQAKAVLSLAGVPDEKITGDRVSRCVNRIIEAVESCPLSQMIADKCNSFSTADVMDLPGAPPPMPPEVGNDVEARANMVISQMVQRKEIQHVR